MREIKFRVWDEIEKRMIYPDSLTFDEEGKLTMAFQHHHLSKELIEKNKIDSVVYTKHAILMQYTGLLDKNNKEIYEGDIIKHTFVVTPNAPHIYKVVFNHARYLLYKSFQDSMDLDNNKKYEVIEVIGNIYENPELLKIYDTSI